MPGSLTILILTFQNQYGTQRAPTFQAEGNIFGRVSPNIVHQNGVFFVTSDAYDANVGSQNIFNDNPAFSGGVISQSGRTFQDIFGADGGRPGGEFPGTIPSNFPDQQKFSFGVLTNGLPFQVSVLQAEFESNAGLGGDASAFQFPEAGSTFQFGGDVSSVFQPLTPSFAGSSRVIEARPDVTLTRTITEDSFYTTTDVAFVKEPYTATMFTLVAQTSVTTVVRK